LWLAVNRPGAAPTSGGTEARFEAGNAVGALAKTLFFGTEDATVYNVPGDPASGLAIAAQIRRTQELLAGGAACIAEASFGAENLYCAVDLLKKNGEVYDIYEVKSSTRVAKSHLIDVAFQKTVLESCGLTVGHCYVAHLNNRYVRSGGIEVQKLFTLTPVDEEIAPYLNGIAETIARAIRTANQAEEPTCDIGKQCAEFHACAFYEYCTAHLPKPSVFDLYRLSGDKQLSAYRAGIVSFADIREKGLPLNAAQRRQVDWFLDKKPLYVDRDGVRAYLRTLRFPLYFLDFETYQTPIPDYDGVKCYAQVPFQYSLHILPAPGTPLLSDDKLVHVEFLADATKDCRFELAKRLVGDIKPGGTMVAYNKAFEESRIRELAALFPTLADGLTGILAKTSDLLKPFQDGYVYDTAMGGGFSIKNVLPALFPHEPELDYHTLSDVHNGAEAQAAYEQLKVLKGEDLKKLRAALLAYCERDTFAMVKIYARLCALAAE
jgi:hypothetical protein